MSVPGDAPGAFLKSIPGLVRRHRWSLLALVVVLGLTAAIEGLMGRLPLGPDHRFGWWDGNIWSSENSQRVADAYSFSHVIHGMLFYGLLWLVARERPLPFRFAAALLLEAGWEVLENSPIIINRYREATIALGYMGDSILNSCCDVLMMALGFVFARHARVRTTAAAILAMELLCLAWVRDNLTLNVIMLVHPIEAIKAWQAAGQPMP